MGKRRRAAAERPSAEQPTAGDTSTPDAQVIYTRLLRSAGTDHREVQRSIARGLHALAHDLDVDPNSESWVEAVKFVTGVFNLGRSLAYRSMARSIRGEADIDEFPRDAVWVEVGAEPCPGCGLRPSRWYYREGREAWTLHG
jgi:hypothetical protein